MYFFRNKFSCFDNLQLLGISVQFFNAEFMLRSITQKFLSINSPLNNFWVLKKMTTQLSRNHYFQQMEIS